MRVPANARIRRYFFKLIRIGVIVFISNAYAQSPLDGLGLGSNVSSILPLILMFAAMYFLMIRPQQKRAKEQKAMIEALAKGDESWCKKLRSRSCCQRARSRRCKIAHSVGFGWPPATRHDASDAKH